MKAAVKTLLGSVRSQVKSRFYVDFPSISDGCDERTLLYRHRKQRGVNIGSWFVLERWITEQPFRCAAPPCQSDLDVARGAHANEILEHHWDSWVSATDFEWLSAMGINTVRIPIGYYHLCGVDPSILRGTDFDGLESIFGGAWSRIVKAIETADRYQIGVLFDLHAAPGKQNQDSHSGTSSPTISFFQMQFNLQLTVRILRILVSSLRSLRFVHRPPLPNVIGVELLNEPKPPYPAALQAWYKNAIEEVRRLDPSLPLFISDCWMPDAYADFVKMLPPTAPPICLDHHLYRCFTSEDVSTAAAQHSTSLSNPNAPTPQTFARVASKLEDAGGALVVGEWSGALNLGSLVGAADERRERAQFIQAQLDLFERHCAGWFFWTYKKEFPGDSGWSFRDAVDTGVFPCRVGLFPVKSIPRDHTEWAERKVISCSCAAARHMSYWAQYPGRYEHWRFEKGYDQGWVDAYYFLTSGAFEHGAVSELGLKGIWKRKRVHEHALRAGHSNNLWEYEHGYQQGVEEAAVDFQRAYC
ncbi:glycoside hydrolase family 5 protein [Pisolithus orientalis]|uniref:glycoside hydrolase family 5 protein n=1 Tax=Pisolithus orientalis TaxID=936130 RepID=UPI0022241FA6|nr:glycoside hydrolase family 5 protein [Pisolithus orientalis]KAI6000408.1 glycoside hydrolase family 5 protein [Pisolithus orientalis]